MKHLLIYHIIFLLFFLSVSISSTLAQDNATIWIGVTNNTNPLDSPKVYMVNSSEGSNNLDSLNTCYVEYQCPPDVEVTWRPFASYVSATYGFGGLCYMDIRGIPSSPAKKDTFVIDVSSFDIPPNANITMTWPDQCFLQERCDSMFLVDQIGLFSDTSGKPIGTINMFQQNSVTVYQPFMVATFKLFIYKYGVHLVDYIDSACAVGIDAYFASRGCVTGILNHQDELPASFGLGQSYPNPFNPSTQIKYSIPKSTNVSLKIYDVLGREIATLVNGKVEPGEHSVNWNALNVPSGVYFYRLIAGDFVQTKKMVLMK